MAEEDWDDDGEDGWGDDAGDGDGWGDVADDDDDDDILADAETPKPKKQDDAGISLLDVIKQDELNKDAHSGFARDGLELMKEQQALKELYADYRWIYFAHLNGKVANEDEARGKVEELVTRLWEGVELPKTKPSQIKEKKWPKDCEVCYSSFKDVDRFVATADNYGSCCSGCFRQHFIIRVKEKDVMPWIPTTRTDTPVYATDADLLYSSCEFTTMELVNFCQAILEKRLAPFQNWVPCKNPKCSFGFLAFNEGKELKKCEACHTSQEVSFTSDVTQDKGFEEMVKEGTLRFCPNCNNPTIKDKGLCNVIQCGKCSIWWNWKSRKTGSSSRELKAKARSDGTLWEPGELAYQQKLQRENLPAFIALLKRNGITYDPNYVRGSGS